MEKEITAFISYLHNIKKTSNNTEMSYKRDLEKMEHFMVQKGIQNVEDVTEEALSGYIKYLKDNHFATATVSNYKQNF